MPIDLTCSVWENSSFPENITSTKQAAYFNELLVTAQTKFPSYDAATQAQCLRNIQNFIRYFIKNPVKIESSLQLVQERQCANFPLIIACITFARSKTVLRPSSTSTVLPSIPNVPELLSEVPSPEQKKARADALVARSAALATRATQLAGDPKEIFFRAFAVADAFEQAPVAAIILLDCLLHQKNSLSEKEILILLQAAPVEIAAFILRAEPELSKKHKLSNAIIIVAIQNKLTALKQQGLFASAAALIADTWQQYAKEFLTDLPLLTRYLVSIVKIYPELQPQLLSTIQPKQAAVLKDFFEAKFADGEYRLMCNPYFFAPRFFGLIIF